MDGYKHKQNSALGPVKQGFQRDSREPSGIEASAPYDFASKNLTSYGSLLPVAIALEMLQLQQVVEQTLTGKRRTPAMSVGPRS